MDNVILNSVFNAWETFLTKPCSREVEKSWYPWGTRIGWDLLGGLCPILTMEVLNFAAEESVQDVFSVLVPTLPWLTPHTMLIFLLHSILYDALPVGPPSMCVNRILYPLWVGDCTVFKKMKNEGCFLWLEHILEQCFCDSNQGEFFRYAVYSNCKLEFWLEQTPLLFLKNCSEIFNDDGWSAYWFYVLPKRDES